MVKGQVRALVCHRAILLCVNNVTWASLIAGMTDLCERQMDLRGISSHMEDRDAGRASGSAVNTGWPRQVSPHGRYGSRDSTGEGLWKAARRQRCGSSLSAALTAE